MSTNLLLVTTVTGKTLASTRVAAATATTVYTVPSSTTAKISHATLCNTTGSAVTVSVSVVPSGGTVDGTHTIIDSFSIAAHDSYPLTDYLAGATLGAGDFISVTPSAGNAIVVLLSGVELA